MENDLKSDLKRIPVIFQDLGDIDERFMKVKIWLMHLGKNYNGSFFEKEVVQDAIPSLANTPILGYIETNSDGEKDFSDHRTELVVEEDDKGRKKYKFEYKGQAYGVIPENNNAKFEKRVGDDGVEREYLTVEGIMWKKWEDPITIMNRDNDKAQSMELSENYEGDFQDDNLFHFSRFKFFGACILGTGVQPAMNSASLEKYGLNSSDLKSIDFTVDVTIDEEAKKEIQEKMEEIKLLFSENKEGGTKMPTSKDFALGNNHMSFELSSALKTDFEQDNWGYKRYNLFYVDHNNETVFAQSRTDEWRLVGYNYSMNGDKPVIDFDSKKVYRYEYVEMKDGEGTATAFSLRHSEAVEYDLQVKEKEVEAKLQSEFATKEEELNAQLNEVNNKIETLEQNFATLENEKAELLDFKLKKLEAERSEAERELFARFDEQLSADEINAVKEKSAEMTIDQIEIQLFALVGKKNLGNFSTKNEPINKVVLDNKPVESNRKSYADLIESYKK